jgi:hypothetical protein
MVFAVAHLESVLDGFQFQGSLAPRLLLSEAINSLLLLWYSRLIIMENISAENGEKLDKKNKTNRNIYIYRITLARNGN